MSSENPFGKAAADITVNITDFDDAALTDDEIIAKAFAYAAQYKSKTLVFSGRDFIISRAITVDSDTEVIIDGVKIKQADKTFDNVFRGNNITLDKEYPNGLAVGITDIENIKITGKNGAEIAGPDINRKDGEEDMVGDKYGWRTVQILFAKVNGCEISDLHFTKTRCWCISFEMSKNVKVHDVNVVSACPNGDGVDVRTGCSDFEIYNISGSTMDDCVACTGIYGTYLENKDKDAYPMEISRGLKPFMSAADLAIHHIKIHDITATGRYHQIICCSAGGIKIHDIEIRDCRCFNTMPVRLDALIEMYSGRYLFFGDYTDDDISDVHIHNIDNSVYPYVLRVDDKVKNVTADGLIQRRSDGDGIFYYEKGDGVSVTNSKIIK